MDSELIAAHSAIVYDIERPRRGLTALLSMATLAVWSFAAVATANAAALSIN